MGGLPDLFASIPLVAWGMFALGAAITAAAGVLPHLRRAWHQWRLDRRLARNPYMLQEEMNEYRYALGEELEPINRWRLLGDSLLAGLFVARPFWLAELGFEYGWEAGLLAYGALGLLLAWWRWMNDPASDPAVLKLPQADVPREAIAGFGAAMGVIGLILFAIWLF